MSKPRRESQKERKRLARKIRNGTMDSKFSMRPIQPITDTQADLFDDYRQGYNICAIGTAGTGKTMCAMYLALSDVLEKEEYDQVVIIRSAVQTRPGRAKRCPLWEGCSQNARRGLSSRPRPRPDIECTS